MIIKCLSIVLLFLLAHCITPTTDTNLESSNTNELSPSSQLSSNEVSSAHQSSDASSGEFHSSDESSNQQKFDTIDPDDDSSEDDTPSSSSEDTPEVSSVQEATYSLCTDRLDNNQNGLVDCADEGCHIFDICEKANDGTGGGTGNGDLSDHGGFCGGQEIAAETFVHFRLNVYDHTDDWEDFGSPAGAGPVVQGLITNKLDSNGLPQFRENLVSNANIGKWWTEEEFPVHETTIQFSHLGGGQYLFKDMEFFPLNGPFTGVNDNPNYSFAAHFQKTFMYDGAPGQNFYFSGSDDVWVFLNGNLVLDIGGVHLPAEDSFVLEAELNRLGIQAGDDVTLDFFIAERKKPSSQAIITINIPCLFK